MQFNIILSNVLEDPQFIESHQYFDWVQGLIAGLHHEGLIKISHESGLVANLKLRNTRVQNVNSTFLGEISIDIVPCIHIDGWWPDEALPNVCDNIKSFGCNLVFDQPQRKYPWVPFSEPCARISFAPAESEMIKQSSDIAKAAYMIGKQLIRKSLSERDPSTYPDAKNSYVLKTSLLYCIEAFTAYGEKANELGSSFTDVDLSGPQFWLEKLMKCYLEFYLQDFCPCYFMPSFSLPIGKYLKDRHLAKSKISKTDFIEVCISVYCLYCYISDRDLCVTIETANPVWETFKREKFMAELMTERSNSAPKADEETRLIKRMKIKFDEYLS